MMKDLRLKRWSSLLTTSVLVVLFLPEMDKVEAKTSRVRTNFKLRVGEEEDNPIGRYTPYSQVRIPDDVDMTFHTLDAEKYYMHEKGARITKASHFDYEFELGHKIVFICVAKGSPRPRIVWFKDGAEIFDHRYLHISEFYRGRRRLKSKMEIDPATQKDAGIYECHANNKWSVDMRSFRTDYTEELD